MELSFKTSALSRGFAQFKAKFLTSNMYQQLTLLLDRIQALVPPEIPIQRDGLRLYPY